MKKIFIIIVCFAFYSPAFAVEEVTEIYRDTGVPTREGVSETEGLHGTVGGRIYAVERIRGHDGGIIVLGPMILMRYNDLVYWSFGGGGVWLLQTDDHSFRFGIGLRGHGGWRAGDDQALAGMERRKASVDGYVNALWRTELVTVGAAYYHDVLNGNRGDSASLRFTKDFRLSEKIRFTPSLGFEWQNSERVDYYYGVRPAEALSFRPAYTGVSTINVDAGISSVYRLGNSWSLLAGVFATRLGNGILDSPIVFQRYSAEAYVGAGWSF